MTTHIKTALALMIGIVLGGVGFGALHAQTKAPSAYWVTELLEMRERRVTTSEAPPDAQPPRILRPPRPADE